MSHYLNNDYVLECIVYVVYMLIPLVIQILFFWRGKYNLGRGNTFYKRTQRGEELNKKLEGLKHYLEDYSLLSEREAKEIELWEDYLIYSVMFGQNKKVIEEYEKYIEIEEDSRI